MSSSFYGKNLTIMTFNVDICFLYATIINTVLLCYKFFNYNISKLNIFQKNPLKKHKKENTNTRVNGFLMNNNKKVIDQKGLLKKSCIFHEQ